MAFEGLKQLGSNISRLFSGKPEGEEPITQTTNADSSTDATLPETQEQVKKTPTVKEEEPEEKVVIPQGNQELLEQLQKGQKIKDLAPEEKTPTFDELYPSMKEGIEHGQVSGAGLSMPVYASSLLFPYALLDKRVNAQLRQAKMKQLYADKLSLKAPDTFYNYQPTLTNNFMNFATGNVAEEKAKGGDWFSRLKDPNGSLMQGIRDFKEYADEMKVDAPLFANIEKQVNGADADKYYLAPSVRKGISDYLHGYGEFAKGAGGHAEIKDLIGKVRNLAAKAHIAVSYKNMLDNEYSKVLKGNADIDTDFQLTAQQIKEAGNDPEKLKEFGLKPNYTTEDYQNSIALQVQNKYMNPDRALNIADTLIGDHTEALELQLLGENKHLPRLDNGLVDKDSDEYKEMQSEIATDITHLVGNQTTDKIDKLRRNLPSSRGGGSGSKKSVVNHSVSDNNFLNVKEPLSGNIIKLQVPEEDTWTPDKGDVITDTTDYLYDPDKGTVTADTGEDSFTATSLKLIKAPNGQTYRAIAMDSKKGGVNYTPFKGSARDKVIANHPELKDVPAEKATMQEIVNQIQGKGTSSKPQTKTLSSGRVVTLGADGLYH